ncbi:MAG: hypothetical protein HGB21_12125 [Nitrospirae bacterium]|nr:hypothetical protein [Nitrospirota bacterium]NTW67033.1 hypothetical protein [Nitrospirota bacterium]
MKRSIVIAALVCLAAAPAFADVSNEVVVGWEGDSTSKVESNVIVDPQSKIDQKNSLFTVQYTHFFTPLKDDDKPIDLRQFYQHPSTLSAGLVFIGAKDKDNTLPGSATDSKLSAAVLQFGGEYFFPTNTGLFLNIGLGGGTVERTVNGVSRPDTDIAHSSLDLGVRQYVIPELELHLRYHGESTKSTQSGVPDATSDVGVVYFGGRGVIADAVGITLELGGGKTEDEQGGSTTKYDIAAMNFEIAGYIGKHLTLRLAIEAEEEKETGMAAGEEYKITTARTTLAGRYWFSERFGMELPIYAESTEEKFIDPVGEAKLKTTNSGIGLYAAFRF